MFKSLIQPLQLFIKGATGKDRHRSHKLTQQLMQLQIAYDSLQEDCTALQQKHSALKHQHTQLKAQQAQLEARHALIKTKYEELKKESNTLIGIADSEVKEWLAENEKLRSQLGQVQAEKDALAGEVIVLEHKLSLEKFAYSADSSDATSAGAEAELALIDGELIDLSNISLALVGGHETTHRKVKEELEKYGLKRCVHVPPHSRESNSRDQVKDKISNCDLVVTITSYLNHSLSESVKKLKASHVLAGEVIWLHSHGKSSVVRTVLDYFSDYPSAA